MKDFILGMCTATIIAGFSCGLVFGCKEIGEPMPPGTPDQVTTAPCAVMCAHRKEIGCLEPALESDCIPACAFSTAHHWLDPNKVAKATIAEMPALGIRCGR